MWTVQIDATAGLRSVPATFTASRGERPHNPPGPSGRTRDMTHSTGISSRTMKTPDGKLPVVTDTNEGGGCGCDRRTVLQGMAVASVVGACRIDVGGEDPASDAPGGPDGPGGTGFELCGADMVCVDLAHPLNASLTSVGGSRVIQQGTTRILIGRNTDTDFTTVSSVCTHAGCTVRFELPMSQLRCPCHNSRYMFDGTLISGAVANQDDLRQFTNTFDSAAGILTITIA
jgi:Rieske Fe-S protein